MSGGSKKKVTVGYWYGLGAHMVFCHGPVDAVTEIIVGEKIAWSGSATSNSDIGISARELFGGEKKEGGVDGTMRLRFGGPAQTADSYLASKLGGSVPAFRGVLSAIWDGLVAANNPYIKPWAIRARRIPSAWYAAKAAIGSDANPAHIIRECLTNAEWGLGYPDADIDDTSFAAAADTLYDEGFGLSFLWQQEATIEAFLGTVVQHIDGMVYVHPTSGKFTLRLARDDYDAGTLPVLSPSNVIRLEEFARSTWAEIVNQVTVVYHDGTTDKDGSVTIQDIAAIDMQGSVVSTTLRYPGISTGALANQVAMRELRQLSSALAKVSLVANRTASSLRIGDVFKLTWPAYGIDEMVMRIVRIGYGERTAGEIRIDAVQDVFGLPDSVYSDPPATSWSDPISTPAAAPYRQLFEATYWAVARDLAADSELLLGEVLPDEGFVQVLAARPSEDAYAFELIARASPSAPWESHGEGAFAPTALTAAAIAQGATSIVLPITSASGLDGYTVALDSLALIDAELLQVTALDLVGGTVTLDRGMLDTVPAAHSSGARIWFVDAAPVLQPGYLYGDTARVKCLTRTGLGTLTEAGAPENTTGITRRFIRPYPPGEIALNGAVYPATVAGDLVIDWATRNRQTQTAYLVAQDDGSITPETGQTTTVRIKNKLGTLVRTYSGLTGASQTWDVATAAADAGTNGDTVTLEIESARDGYISLQMHSITVARAGYGMRYGQYYGGV